MRGPFGLLWAGQSVSLLGDTVFLIAFTWQLAVAWHRPGLLGVLLAARVAAELVTLGLGGWIVDWIARRDLIGAADAVRAGLLLGLALFLHQPPPVVPMAIILALFGVATALFRPALGAYIPQIVPPKHLQAANARLGLSQQAATLAGPAIGAGLVAVGSASTALRLDALSFALAAISALFLPRRAPAAHGGGGALAATLEGFRVVRRAWWLGGGILLASLVNIATITAERLALPQVANQRYGHLGGYATILFTISVGAIVTNLVMDRLRPPQRPGRVFYAAVLAFGSAIAAFRFGAGLAAAGLVGVAFGATQQLLGLLWTTGLQRYVPDRLLGRVNAIDDFGSFLFLPLSFALGGVVVQAVSPTWVLVGAGAIAVVAAAIGLAVPALHRWRPLGDDVGAPPAFPPSVPYAAEQAM
jgi:MFS family permease